MNGILAVGLGLALDIAAKATILFSLSLLAVAALRRSGAAARHIAGTAGLAGGLALPLLTLALPRLEVPLLRSPLPAVTTRMDSPRPARAAGAPLTEQRISPWIEESAGTTPAVFRGFSESPAAPAPRVSWLAVVLAAWIAGALFAALRLAIGVLRVRKMREEASPLRGEDLEREMEALASRLTVRRPVELYESSRVPVAITSGLFRPFLLLCRQARVWAVERRRVVLLHELAHVRRADWVWLVLAETALAIYWWHPLARLLAGGVRRDAEKACDDLVLAAGTKPSVYAGHLLGIFRSLGTAAHPVAPALASARPSHFEGRLRAILDPAGPRGALPRMRAALSAAALFAAAAALSAVAVWVPGPSDGAIAATRAPRAAGKSSVRADHSPACPYAKTAAKTAAPPRSSSGSACPKSSASTASSAEAPPADRGEPLPESGRALPAILKNLARIKESAGGFVRASERLSNAARCDGSASYDKAMDLHRDGRWDEAIAAFAKAIEAGYREDAASYNIACGYARKGDRDRAFKWLGRAMEAGFDVQGYLGRDEDLNGLKSDPRWRELKKAAESRPSKRAEREAAAAVARYERLVAKAPKDGEPFYDVGKDLLNAGRYDLSAKAFDESAARGYRVGTSFYNGACALSRGGQTRAALDLLQKSLDAGFDQPDLFEKDDDLDNLRDDPRFAGIAKEARDLSLPGDGLGDWLGRSSEWREKWRQSARRFDQYARANPHKGRAWFNLGYASLAGDRPEAAIEAFRKALDRGYRRPTTMYNLACGYARLDQKDAAFDWLFKALDAGFGAAGMLRSDEDLDNLRGDSRFRKALQIARAGRRAAD